MTRRWPTIGVALAVLWLFVRGVSPEPATVAGEFLLGLLVGLPIAYATRGFYTTDVRLRRAVGAVPWVLRYLAVFLVELIIANVEVAYRVLAPSMPIDPDVVAIPLRVETDAAIATIANSITLTPGTLTMDHEPATNTLYVHAIAASDRRAVVGPIRRLEDYALRIFDEPADPGDRPPGRSGPTGVGPPDDTADDHSAGNDGADPERGDSAGNDAHPERNASVGEDANPEHDASAGDDDSEGHRDGTGGHADGE
ncbi:cation transporter [Halobacteriales archaeon QS_1_69_70]|nr:MAG: cation transporter [Halobacteriales archaeon QS_1_69_70]